MEDTGVIPGDQERAVHAPTSNSFWAERLPLVLFAFLGLHIIFLMDTVMDAVKGLPLRGDWFHLYTVGKRVWSGDLKGVYDLDYGAQLFWRYPPFCLLVVAVFAIFPPVTAFWVQFALQLSCVALVVWLFPAEPLILVVTAILTSAPLADTLATGQNSGVLLAVIAVGSLLWSRGQTFTAGLVLGLLAAKPNWGLPFGLFAVAVGEWRVAFGMAGSIAVLCLASLPIGTDMWVEFLKASTQNSDILARYPGNRVITLWGTLEALLSPAVARIAWWTLVAGMLAAMVRIVRTRPRIEQLAALTLFATAANPYASYYDALVLVFPALVWLRRERQGSFDWAVGTSMAATWIACHAAMKYYMLLGTPPPSFALTGACVTAWLLVDGVNE